MAHLSDLIATDIEEYLRTHEQKTLLRFITCGSVDDGKSTLIGRLLYESKMLFEDQLAAVEADSKRWGTQGGALDLALLVDGLAAEREQGITIDVAYRFFSTAKRKFIVADTPGHEQYTRNMITGASTADLAVILVDARKGVLTQTRRHSYLVSLIGIRRVVLAVNKMDLVGFSEDLFRRIAADYAQFATELGLTEVTAIPLSALTGANVTESSAEMAWYAGPTLISFLETVQVDGARLQMQPFRFPIQWVNRPNLDFRGYAGTVASGTVRPGDRIRLLPSGRSSTVARVLTFDGDLEQAVAGQSVTLTLTDEVDLSRGDLLCHESAPAEVADQFEATLVWMGEEPLLPGRPYLLKLGAATVSSTVSRPAYKVDVNTLEQQQAETLNLNEIGSVVLSLDRIIAFDPYRENPATGGFILIDRLSNNTVAAGMLSAALRRARHIHRQHLAVTREARAALKGQKPCVLWFTGLPGAGKSTIANQVELLLHDLGRHTCLLDGDNLRHGLSRDLAFSAADRAENVRRVAEVARLMTDAGLITLVSLVSPFRADREMARRLFPPGQFLEIFIDAPLSLAEARDPKGLYQKARRGELKGFTGIGSPYEAPEHPEIRIETAQVTPGDAAEQVVQLLRRLGVLDQPHGLEYSI